MFSGTGGTLQECMNYAGRIQWFNGLLSHVARHSERLCFSYKIIQQNSPGQCTAMATFLVPKKLHKVHWMDSSSACSSEPGLPPHVAACRPPLGPPQLFSTAQHPFPITTISSLLENLLWMIKHHKHTDEKLIKKPGKETDLMDDVCKKPASFDPESRLTQTTQYSKPVYSEDRGAMCGCPFKIPFSQLKPGTSCF